MLHPVQDQVTWVSSCLSDTVHVSSVLQHGESCVSSIFLKTVHASNIVKPTLYKSKWWLAKDDATLRRQAELGEFNLPGDSTHQQHSQGYPVGAGSAEAIAAAAGQSQPDSEELFADAQPQHNEAEEELFGRLSGVHVTCQAWHAAHAAFMRKLRLTFPPS